MRGHRGNIGFAGDQAFLTRGVLLKHFASGGARNVHRDIASADHDHSLPDREPVAEVRIQQEIDPFVHAVQVHAGNGEITAAVSAHRDYDRGKALFVQPGDREIPAGGVIQFKRDVARFENLADLGVHDAARQPVFRDAEVHHPSGDRCGVEDGNRIAQQPEVVSRGETDRASADDRDAEGLGA